MGIFRGLFGGKVEVQSRLQRAPRSHVSRPDPHDVAAYEREFERIVVGGSAQPLGAPIEIRDYDPDWPRLYEREEARIRSALGDRVIRIEHAGSTSVPGLPAKPIIDI